MECVGLHTRCSSREAKIVCEYGPLTQSESVMFRRLSLVISAGLVLALCGVSRPALAQREDQIFPAKGAPHRGTIAETGITHDKVTIEVNGTPRQIEVKEIVRITFGGE